MVTLKGSQLPPEVLRLQPMPKKLFVSSDNLDELIKRPRIGIIGSRKITPYGRGVTTKFAHELAGKDVVIVSGLALGVDSIAHMAALQANGTTIAVLPSGLDKIYPATHYHLAKEIITKQGLLVTIS